VKHPGRERTAVELQAIEKFCTVGIGREIEVRATGVAASF
jgi:hypothetical protein